MPRDLITITLTTEGRPVQVSVTVSAKVSRKATAARQVEDLTEEATRALVAACGGFVPEIPAVDRG